MDKIFIKKYAILSALFLIILFLAGCSSGDDDDDKEKERRDRARNAALQRNATVVQAETQRFNLPVCESLGAACTDTIRGRCSGVVPATEPGVCNTAPPLICICPESSACFMHGSDTRRAGQFREIEITLSSRGKCIGASQIVNP
ncbi:hypothetical protein HYY71_04965 [Candidatus Woesearchaeota archaeon]|nr:hypothetical protein [Candidatus Woesearchaeota archaeon]